MQNEGPKAISPASWLAAALISSIVSSAVIINGVSGLFAATNPELALRLNPLRSDERIAVALDRIDDPRTREIIVTGLRLSPADGRLYSVMGILAEHEGDKQSASRFYRYALELLPTEIQALMRQLSLDIEEGNRIDAAEKLKLLGRRWPEYWSAVEPVLPFLLSDVDSYNKIARDFATSAPLRNLLIRSLTAKASTLPFAYRLGLDWSDSALPEVSSVINRITTAFLREKQYAEAYLFFQLTQPEGRRSGYVYNSAFKMPFSGNSFDWVIRDQAGVSFSQIIREDESALSIRFLDNPIQFRNVTQLVRLVPGPYSVTISYEGRALVMPKPIRLGIRCIPSNAMLADAPLSEGSSQHQESVDFVVPATDCALQEIFIYNDKMPMSWLNRYQGTLLLQSVTIRRQSGA